MQWNLSSLHWNIYVGVLKYNKATPSVGGIFILLPFQLFLSDFFHFICLQGQKCGNQRSKRSTIILNTSIIHHYQQPGHTTEINYMLNTTTNCAFRGRRSVLLWLPFCAWWICFLSPPSQPCRIRVKVKSHYAVCHAHHLLWGRK